jgi:hypothetical protein
MKTSQRAAASAVLLAIGAFAPITCLAQGNSGNSSSSIPATPVGEMTAFPTIVQTGTKPTLTWDILYPSNVSNVAVINPPGTLIPTQQIYVSVQPVGTGPTNCTPGQTTVTYPAEARISVNGGSYKQLFYGTQANVEPQYSLYIKRHKANDTIDFGGSYVVNGNWTPFYTTRSSNMQVISLIRGSVPPTNLPLSTSSRLASYLRPYLDATGKINIGPMSVLVLMELSATNQSQPCFDYMDMVLLVTFSTKHPNNGHGNNLDGVDSSNPGQGNGGPNGRVDPSGGVDDEIKIK